MDSMKRQKDMILEDEPSGQRVPICYCRRVESNSNNSRKKEVAGPM